MGSVIVIQESPKERDDLLPGSCIKLAAMSKASQPIYRPKCGAFQLVSMKNNVNILWRDHSSRIQTQELVITLNSSFDIGEISLEGVNAIQAAPVQLMHFMQISCLPEHLLKKYMS